MQDYLREETGIQQTQTHLFSIYKNQAVITELWPKRNSKKHLSPVSLINRQAQPDQFSFNLSSKFSRKGTQNCLSNLLHGLTTLKFTPFSMQSLDYPYCKVRVLFNAILSVTIKNNGLSSSLQQPFTLPHPSLLQATQIQFLLTFSFQYKL